jgi:hypothetical protein
MRPTGTPALQGREDVRSILDIRRCLDVMAEFPVTMLRRSWRSCTTHVA